MLHHCCGASRCVATMSARAPSNSPIVGDAHRRPPLQLRRPAAMLAFGLAGDGARADRLERALVHKRRAGLTARSHHPRTGPAGCARAARFRARGRLARDGAAREPAAAGAPTGRGATRSAMGSPHAAGRDRKKARRPAATAGVGRSPWPEAETAHRLERPLWGRVTFGRVEPSGGTGSDIRASSLIPASAP